MTKNIEPLSNETLLIQSWLRPALTLVLGNRDHQRLVDDLEQLDNNLKASGLEAKAMSLALDELIAIRPSRKIGFLKKRARGTPLFLKSSTLWDSKNSSTGKTRGTPSFLKSNHLP